jgi:hypothetical protein
MEHDPSRRQFLGQTLQLAATAAAAASLGLTGRAAGAVLAAALPATGPAGGAARVAAQMPMIRIGKLDVSRVILGSNPFNGFAHGNPHASGRAMREYYTPQRIMQTLDEAAGFGINAVWAPPYPQWIRLWKQYTAGGGNKLRNWIGQPDLGGEEKMRAAITDCANNGATAICIQGAQIDIQFAHQKYDVVRGWLELIAQFKLPAGMASHLPETHLIAEQQKLPTDFYHQCLGVPDHYTAENRTRALATMRQIAKPVIAYKVLGAGRLDPEQAIPEVLRNIKPIDGMCVGVFPKDNPKQIEQDVHLTIGS